MAASDHQSFQRLPHGPIQCLHGLALNERLEEEISRAGRHGTALSCLLVGIADLEQIAQAHGEALSEEMLAYVELALRREFRRFDRVGRPGDGELLVVLPGADGPRAEIVARRALGRLHAIKIEADGVRRSPRMSVGLASWRAGVGAEELVTQTRAAAERAPTVGS